MKNLPIQLLLLLFSFKMTAQTKVIEVYPDRDVLINMAFPSIKAKTLLGDYIEFPNITKNKNTLVCIAFNDNGKEKFDTWMNTIPSKYKDSTVIFYELALIKNAPKIFRDTIEKGMRKGSPKELHGQLANYYGKIESYKKALYMQDEDSCYVFLLDKAGKIQFSVEGATNNENLEMLDKTIKKLK
jgi:ATP10 protein